MTIGPHTAPGGQPGKPDNPGQDDDSGGKGKANDTLTRDLMNYARASGATDAAPALDVAQRAIAAVGRSSYFALCEWIDTEAWS